MASALEQDEQIYVELREEFLREALDHLEEMETCLNGIFANSVSVEDAKSEIYRNVHTIKGLAQPFGFPVLSELAHRLEDHLPQCTFASQNDIQEIQEYIDEMYTITRSGTEPEPSERGTILNNLPGAAAQAKEQDLKVLLISGSRTVAKKVQSQLKSIGFDVRNMSSTTEAIGDVVRNRPDIVIVSDILDELSGIDVVTALISMPSTANIPVMFLTSFEMDDTALEKLPNHVPVIRLGSAIDDQIRLALTEIEFRFLN